MTFVNSLFQYFLNITIIWHLFLFCGINLFKTSCGSATSLKRRTLRLWITNARVHCRSLFSDWEKYSIHGANVFRPFSECVVRKWWLHMWRKKFNSDLKNTESDSRRIAWPSLGKKNIRGGEARGCCWTPRATGLDVAVIVRGNRRRISRCAQDFGGRHVFMNSHWTDSRLVAYKLQDIPKTHCSNCKTFPHSSFKN